MEHRIVSLTQPDEWRRELAGVAHMPAHTWEYCSAMALSSRLETYLYAGRLHGARVVCPFSIRVKEDGFREMVSPYGFGGLLMPDAPDFQQEFVREWNRHWKEQNIVTAFIMQHPLCRLQAEAWEGLVHEGPRLFILDLRLPRTQLFQNMKSTHRQEIRRLQRENDVQLVEDREILRQALLDLYPRTLQRVGASDVYYFSGASLERLIAMPTSLLLGASLRGRVQAVSLFVAADGAADYFLNASSEEGKRYSRLLLWAGIMELQERGIPWLNLGGGARDGDSLEAFKRRFGGAPVRGQVIRQIFDQTSYDYLMKYAAAGEGHGYFPPYWKGTSARGMLRQKGGKA